MEKFGKDQKQSSNDLSDSSKGKESFTDRIGDAIEKAGHKISETGAPGLGKKIHDLGDRIETHHDNPEHPHDVDSKNDSKY